MEIIINYNGQAIFIYPEENFSTWMCDLLEEKKRKIAKDILSNNKKL